MNVAYPAELSGKAVGISYALKRRIRRIENEINENDIRERGVLLSNSMFGDVPEKAQIIECPPSDPMSFLVPMNLMDSNRMGFRIYGHQFMVDLASVAGLEEPGTYRFYGKYDEDRKAVIVDCSVYRKVSRIRPAKDAG